MSDKGTVSDLAAETVEAPKPHRSQEEQVADILAGASATDREPAEGQAAAEQEPTEAWDIKTAAERLGVDPAKLYELKVSLGEGQEVTLSELKDQWKSKAAIEAEQADRLKERANWEADRIKAEREFSQLLQGFDPQVPADRREAAVKQYQDYVKSREREALLRSQPEWVDPKVENADRAEIWETLRDAGFTEDEWQSTVDHRALRLLRRLVKAEAQVKALTVKPAPKVAAKPTTAKVQTDAQRFGQMKTAVKTGRMRPEDAVASLLKGI